MTIARFSGLRLFIEGIEVPVIQASVTARMMSPAAASIAVPSDITALNLLPRSVIHLFVYDNLRTLAATGDTAHHGDLSSPDPIDDTYLDVTDPKRWLLLFGGELVGFNYQSEVGSRQIVLECLDFSNYWDHAKLYFGGKGVGNKQFKQSVFMGAVVGESGRQKVDSSQAILNILRTKPSTMPTLQGLLGGLVHLLESITGVFAGTPSTRKFRGLSDFMSQAELRLNLTRQLGVNPNDQSSAILTGSQEFKKHLKSMLSRFQGTASFAEIVRSLLAQIHHTYSSVICPPYIPKGAKATFLRLEPIKGKPLDPRLSESEKELDAITGKMDAAIQARVKTVTDRVRQSVELDFPAAGGAVSPSDVVRGESALPDTYQSRLDQNNAVVADAQGQTAWRDKYKQDIPTPQQLEKIRERLFALEDNSLPPAEVRRLRESIEVQQRLASLVTNDLMGEQTAPNQDVNNIFPRHTDSNFAAAQKLLDQLNTLKKKRRGPKYKTVERTIELNDRLITTIFHPMIWMCPPPRCNVFFPEDYRVIRYNRSFLQEVTRTMLFGLRSNGGVNNSQTYFAPNADILSGSKIKNTDVAKAASNSVSFLFPHEKFTGIIPEISGIGNVAALKKLNKRVEDLEPGEAFTSYGAKEPQLSRAAHHKFFMSRYQPRGCLVSGPFVPKVVCGLPALVLNPELDSAPGRAKPWLKGTHLLGLVTSVTHNIGQSGPTTNTSMQFVRAYNETLNIFGTYEHKVTVVKKKVLGGVGIPGEYYAEVLGFRFKQIPYNGSKVSVLVPIVGMNGVPGRSGENVVLGLLYQNERGKIDPGAVAAENIRRELTEVRQRSALDVLDFESGGRIDATLEQYEPGASLFADVEALGIRPQYRISPVFDRSKLGDTNPPEAPRNPSITEPRWLDGYFYKPRLPWMSSSALAAVKVKVFKITGQEGKVVTKDFSFYFEQVARPPWFDDSYLNQNIGEEFYTPLLGCSSITDPQILADLSSATATAEDYINPVTEGSSISELADVFGSIRNSLAADGVPRNKPFKPEEIAQVKKSIDQLDAPIRQRENQFKGNKNSPVLDADRTEDEVTYVIVREDGTEMTIPSTVLGGVSSHEATEVLAKVYTGLKYFGQNAIDTENFITQYSNRSYATMVDIFGYGFAQAGEEGNLADQILGTNYKGVVGTRHLQPFEEYDPGGSYTQEDAYATEGFHSKAFGAESDLNLLNYETLTSLFDSSREPRAINPEVDPRAERYERAVDYRNSLLRWAQGG